MQEKKRLSVRDISQIWQTLSCLTAPVSRDIRKCI